MTNRILGATHPSYCIYIGTIIDPNGTQVAENTIIKQSLKKKGNYDKIQVGGLQTKQNTCF